MDRSNRQVKSVNSGVPFFSLLSLVVETFEADKLPPNRARVPAVNGSQAGQRVIACRTGQFLLFILPSPGL